MPSATPTLSIAVSTRRRVASRPHRNATALLISAARARALSAWMAQARGDLRPPEGVDAPAVNAMIVLGLSYIALASRTSNTVIGLATQEDATRTRIETATRVLVQGAYGKA